MSFDIKLRKCTSENNKIGKSFVSNVDITLNGTFKNSVDVMNPVIQIQTDTNLSEYNYMEIDALGRKYFMSPTVDNNKLWTLTCHVDVLDTYESAIKACTGLVQRTATSDKINYYINDGALYTEQREVIEYFTFKKDGAVATLGTDSYYLLVAGG